MSSRQQLASWSLPLEGLSWLLLVASCCFVVFSLLVYGLGQPYSSLGFAHPMRMEPPFADLRYLIANSECGVDLDAYYKGIVVGCDPAGRTYRFDYPPMSIWLGRFLHVRGGHTPWIAITTGLSLLVSTLGLLRAQLVSSWRWRLLGSAVLMSFPGQQALERGNIDVMLFLVMLLLGFILSRPIKPFLVSLPANLLASLLTFLSVSLKIYPLFGILGLLAYRDKQVPAPSPIQWSSRSTKSLILFAAAAGIFPLLSYFGTVGNLIKEGGIGSHGLMAFGYLNTTLVNQFGLAAGRLLIRSLYVAKAAAILLGFYLAYRTGFADVQLRDSEASKNEHSGFLEVCILLMSSIWLGCYISTINYDYRFLYLVPFIAYLAAIAASARATRFQARWAAVLVWSMLVVFAYPWLRLGYTDLGLRLTALVEPVTEFLLIPVFAGSLLFFLLQKTWLGALGKQTLLGT